MLKSVVIKPTKSHTSTVIFLHGLGDSGHGWSQIGQMASSLLPNVKFIFPHAPVLPITLNNGYQMPAWYDIVSLHNINAKQDEKGMTESCSKIDELIQFEINIGIPSDKIVVGGFSQGAAMSLLYGLTCNHKLGGIVALSGYLPLSAKIEELKTAFNNETRFFMGHGTLDDVVKFQYGKSSADKLKNLGYSVDFRSYNDLGKESIKHADSFENTNKKQVIRQLIKKSTTLSIFYQKYNKKFICAVRPSEFENLSIFCGRRKLHLTSSV